MKDDYLHIRIEKQLKKRLKREAKKRKVSMADFVAEILDKKVP